jgi:Fic family protein
MQLQQQVEHDLQSLGSRAANAQKVVRHLYRHPILAAEKVSEVAEVSMPTAYKLVNSLEDLDILEEITGAERNRLYVFKDYLNLFK